MKTVNKPFRKKDAMQLVTGQPVYMDDIIPQDCLIVKLLRSPHANAIVKNIDTSRAASTEQESTGFSSKNTVHSPQLAVSHPRLTLLQPKERTRSISRVSGAISAAVFLWFNVK